MAGVHWVTCHRPPQPSSGGAWLDPSLGVSGAEGLGAEGAACRLSRPGCMDSRSDPPHRRVLSVRRWAETQDLANWVAGAVGEPGSRCPRFYAGSSWGKAGTELPPSALSEGQLGRCTGKPPSPASSSLPHPGPSGCTAACPRWGPGVAAGAREHTEEGTAPVWVTDQLGHNSSGTLPTRRLAS